MLHWTRWCISLFKLVVSLSLDENTQELALLNHLVVLFSGFWGTPILFSMVVHSSHQQCTRVPFSPYPLQDSSFCLFDNSQFDRHEVIILRFWFAFSWWLVMLSISAFTSWPPEWSSLEKYLFKSSAHFLIEWFLLTEQVSTVYICGILISIDHIICKYILPFSRLSFCFAGDFLCCAF